MSARDDYPNIGRTTRDADQWGVMCDEIDRLRDWKESAMRVLSDWDAVWEAAGQPGALGSSKARAVELEVRRLRQEIDDAYETFDRRMDQLEPKIQAIVESEAFAWGVLADELEPFAKEVRNVANDLGCTPAQALRMLVRYGIVRYDEANDIARPVRGFSSAAILGHP